MSQIRNVLKRNRSGLPEKFFGSIQYQRRSTIDGHHEQMPAWSRLARIFESRTCDRGADVGKDQVEWRENREMFPIGF